MFVYTNGYLYQMCVYALGMTLNRTIQRRRSGCWLFPATRFSDRSSALEDRMLYTNHRLKEILRQVDSCVRTMKERVKTASPVALSMSLAHRAFRTQTIWMQSMVMVRVTDSHERMLLCTQACVSSEIDAEGSASNDCEE